MHADGRRGVSQHTAEVRRRACRGSKERRIKGSDRVSDVILICMSVEKAAKKKRWKEV